MDGIVVDQELEVPIGQDGSVRPIPAPKEQNEGHGLSPEMASEVLWFGKLALEETGGKSLKRKVPFTTGDLRVGGKCVRTCHLPRQVRVCESPASGRGGRQQQVPWVRPLSLGTRM